MNKRQIVTLGITIALVLLFWYSAFGDSTSTREDMILNRIEQYKEDNARIEIHNEMAEDICEKESKSIEDAIESTKSELACLEKNIRKFIDIDKEIEKEFGTGSTNSWTSSSGTVATAPERTVNLRSIFNLWDCRFTNDKHKMPKYNLEWLAYDIACEAGKAFNVSTPNFNKESWTVATVSHGKSIGNYVIIRQWDIRIVYGHTSTQKKEWDVLNSWEVFWITDMSWESTGMHLHLELWKWHKIVSREFFWSDTYDSWDQTRLLAHRRWNFDNRYFFTHYDLGDISQNDWAPCIGASWKDLCELEKKGIRTMAITSDIRKLMGIKFWDTVTLIWDEWCSWTYRVEDEMNKRYRQTPWVKRPWTPYYIKGDIPSKEWWACYILK